MSFTMKRRTLARLGFGAGAILAAPGILRAQGNFPERAGYLPMRLVAGDGSDAFRRHWTQTALPALRLLQKPIALLLQGRAT